MLHLPPLFLHRPSSKPYLAYYSLLSFTTEKNQQPFHLLLSVASASPTYLLPYSYLNSLTTNSASLLCPPLLHSLHLLEAEGLFPPAVPHSSSIHSTPVPASLHKFPHLISKASPTQSGEISVSSANPHLLPHPHLAYPNLDHLSISSLDVLDIIVVAVLPCPHLYANPHLQSIPCFCQHLPHQPSSTVSLLSSCLKP